MEQPCQNELPRERLIKWATREIARHGTRVEVRKLIKLAHTSPGRFHEYFQCRDNLLIEVYNNGWEVMQRGISRRFFATFPTNDFEEIVVAVVEGLLDALDEDREAVSATLVLACTTIGQEIRPRLKESAAFKWYEATAKRVEGLLSKNISEPAAKEGIHLIFGSVVRRLLLCTPMYELEGVPPLNRSAFVQALRRMVGGILGKANETGFDAEVT